MSGVIVPAITEAEVAGLEADLASKADTGGHDALSVVGRAANTSGDAADIAAGSDDQVLRRSGTAIGFGTVATAGITNSAVTYAKIQDVSATSRILGRATTGAGVIEELTAAQVQTILGVNSDWANRPDADPVSPDTLDDEFNGASLDGDWTAVNTTDLEATPYVMAYSSIQLRKKLSTSTISGYKQSFSPGTADWVFQAKMDLWGVKSSTGFPLAGLFVTDGTKFLIGGWFLNGAVTAPKIHLEYWTTTSNFSSNIIDTALTGLSGGPGLADISAGANVGFPLPSPVWLRLARSGSDVNIYTSPNGMDWNLYTGTGAITTAGFASSISGVGIGCANNNGMSNYPRFFHFRKVA